jgi:polar amino acid transport system substrate-binding protein
VSTPSANVAFDLLVAGKVDAVAGLTQGLLDRAQQLSGSRLVDGRFMAVQQSIAVPKGRDAGLAYLRGVVEEAKTSGLVARAIEKTGVRGVAVAPPAK